MNDFRDVLGSKMSTGMKQKVSIARTIVHDPPVLIFDEPTSGLDVLVQRAVLQKILELRDLGKTILFSTHSMHEVEKLCRGWRSSTGGRSRPRAARENCWNSLTSPSLEELFFALVEKAETSSGLPETGNRRSHIGAGCRYPIAPAFPRTGLSHALVEPVCDLSPRSPRSASRPAHAVHDLRASRSCSTRSWATASSRWRRPWRRSPGSSWWWGRSIFPRAAPPLLNPEGNGFNPELFDSPHEASLLIAQSRAWRRAHGQSPETREQAVRNGLAAAVMVIPSDLPDQFRNKNDVEIPIHYKSVDEPSQITYLRLREVLDRWKRGIVDERRKQDKLPQGYTQPIQVKGVDVATAQEVGGNVWSRIFPFLLVMMSLTGAFYPAVDLCAGEKERGTMETLLISPATRAEIVLGKFLTVMLASVLTALLNLVSMGLTGIQMAAGSGVGRMAAETGRHAAAATIAPPTLQSAFWMIILLIPLAAFFSAICVALAVLARSMKEGQYYMTPLYLVCLPLILLTLMPEIELNLFYSLVPITGVALLLRALIMGDYQTAVRFFLPVMVPTVVYAAVALRWAIDQFQREEVLFREAERFNLAHWLKHLIRDRQPMPTGGQATLCFALILTASWFSMLYMAMERHRGNDRGSGGRAVPDPASPPDHGGDAHLVAPPHVASVPGRPHATWLWPSASPWRSTRWSTSCGTWWSTGSRSRR